MQQVRETIAKIADLAATVLVSGETGTGKELVARAIHRSGRRQRRPFVTVNCAAVPAALLESELFGHAAGAFTGAERSKRGLMRSADGGTLLLDEIGDMPLALQPKLLRVLQSRKVRPVGCEDEVSIDVRVICTANIDLADAVTQKRFRADLFYRVSAIQLELPPLRERGEDDLLLARAFIKREAAKAGKSVEGLTEAAADCLRGYPWPGNVRELQNAIEHAVAFTTADQIAEADLPDVIRAYAVTGQVEPPVATLPTLAEVERRHIVSVLQATGGSPAHAARILGISRTALERKLVQHGVRLKRPRT